MVRHGMGKLVVWMESRDPTMPVSRVGGRSGGTGLAGPRSTATPRADVFEQVVGAATVRHAAHDVAAGAQTMLGRVSAPRVVGVGGLGEAPTPRPGNLKGMREAPTRSVRADFPGAVAMPRGEALVGLQTMSHVPTEVAGPSIHPSAVSQGAFIDLDVGGGSVEEGVVVEEMFDARIAEYVPMEEDVGKPAPDPEAVDARDEVPAEGGDASESGGTEGATADEGGHATKEDKALGRSRTLNGTAEWAIARLLPKGLWTGMWARSIFVAHTRIRDFFQRVSTPSPPGGDFASRVCVAIGHVAAKLEAADEHAAVANGEIVTATFAAAWYMVSEGDTAVADAWGASVAQRLDSRNEF
ncbi:unnamed protein product [Closterium sp. Yama58-4]|nr:unnamed protein product [Closterium sp. Yama58-4]